LPLRAFYLAISGNTGVILVKVSRNPKATQAHLHG
jgi:hypothetical protein